MTIKIGTGSSAVEPSELILGGLTDPVQRVMVGTGNDAVPVWVLQDPTVEPVSASGGKIEDTYPRSWFDIFTTTISGTGTADIHASLDSAGYDFVNGAARRYLRVEVNGTWVGGSEESGTGRFILEHTSEAVDLVDGDVVSVRGRSDADANRVIHGWTVDITPVRVEEPVDPAVETTTALTIDPSSVEVGEPVTLTATVTPSNAVGSVTFDGAGETSVVDVVNGVATTTRTFSALGEYEVSAEFTPTSEEDFLPSSDTTSITVVEGAPVKEVVKINGISTWDARGQFRDALSERGLDYATIETVPFDIDASGSVTLYGMFGGCDALVEAPEMDITGVTSLERLFSGCSSLEYVPDLYTSHVDNMYMLFYQCSSLTDGNVRLIGRHPEVDTGFMISGSGLTFEPFYTEGETVTDLTITPSSVIAGNPVTLTATITPQEAVGVVEFLVGSQTLTADVIDGVATTTAIPQETGEYDVTANFIPGSEDFLPSSDTASVNVTLIVTSTVLTVADEFDIGEVVPMTATVTPSDAVGEVSFTVGTQTLTAALEAGTAQSEVIIEDPGLYDITAEFIPAPGANFDPSSDTVQVLAVDPDALPVVEIISDSTYGARDELRAALSERGLDYQTVEYLPFDLDVSGATNLGYMFNGMSALKEVPEMDTWHITSMRSMFDGCSSLTEIPDLDTSNVDYALTMFRGCSSLVEAPNIDTSKMRSLWGLYDNCTSLVHVPDIDASSATSMYGLFSGCTSLVEAPQVYNTENVTTAERMFYECESLTSVPDMDTSNVTNMRDMFLDTPSLTDGNVRLFGKHPDVDTTDMIRWSGLTFEPFYDEEGNLILPELVPMEWSGGEVVDTTSAPIEVVNYTVVGYGVADLNATLDAEGYGMSISAESLRTIYLRVNGTSVGTETESSRLRSTIEHTFSGIELEDGDVLTFLVRNSSLNNWFIHGWSLDLVPAPPAVETQAELSTDPFEVTEGGTATLRVAVTPASATGSVTFDLGGETVTVPVIDGVAATNVTVMQAGDYEVNVLFSPVSEDYLPSSATGNLKVLKFVPDPVETTTTLVVVPDEITEGEQVTLTAIVSPSEAVGEVTFTVGTQTSTVPLEAGVAQSEATLEIPGDYEVTAEFVPTNEADFLPSSDTASITVIPDPVETSTSLSVVPDEIEEGELVTVTATVTPVEAAGSVEFDVAGQPSTVNILNGEASTTATLEEAGEHAITADFVPTSEEDFLPSSATSSVTVTESAPAELVPMSWGNPTGISSPPTSEIEVVNYTVVGNGVANLPASLHAGGNNYGTWGSTSSSRYMYLYVNGVEVGRANHSRQGLATLNTTFEGITLEEGDVLTFAVRNASSMARSIRWWTLDLIPL